MITVDLEGIPSLPKPALKMLENHTLTEKQEAYVEAALSHIVGMIRERKKERRRKEDERSRDGRFNRPELVPVVHLGHYRKASNIEGAHR